MPDIGVAQAVGATAEYESLLSVLERIAWDLNGMRDTHAVLGRIVGAVVEYTPWTICWAGLFRPDEDAVAIQRDSGLWNDLAEPSDWDLTGSPSLVALETGSPLSLENIQEDVRFPLVAADAQARAYSSVLIIPLRTGGVRGALWLCGPSPHEHTSAEIAFGRVLGALTAIALNNVQLVDQERDLRVEREDELNVVRDLKELAERRNAALTMLAATHERLLRGVLDGGSFGELAESIGSLVKRPVLLMDQSGDPLSWSRALNGRAEQISERLRELSIGTLQHFDAMRAATVYVDETSYSVSPVILDGVTFGALWVEQVDGELDDTDRRVLDQAALVVALEFLKERIRLGAELANQRDFAQMVIGGLAKDSHIRSRAALLGIDLDAPSRLFRIRLQLRPTEPRDISPVAMLVQRRLRHTVEAARVLPLPDGDMVVFLPEGGPSTSEEIANLLRTLAVEGSILNFGHKPGGIQIGISGVSRGTSTLHEAFLQASRCLDVMDALSRNDGSLSTDDAGSYALLIEIDRDRQEAFATRVLQAVEKYDSKHAGELLRTLDVFLSVLGSVQRTAEVLFLHQTTVRYRLKRIEELSGFSLTNAEDRLRLQLAIHLRRISMPSG